MAKYIYMLPVWIRVSVLTFVTVIILLMIISKIRRTSIENLRRYAYKAMKYAEKKWNESGRGPERMKWVVMKVKGKIPPVLRPFVSDRFIEDTLQLWFYQIKDLLDDGSMNMSEPKAEKNPERDKTDFIERSSMQ